MLINIQDDILVLYRMGLLDLLLEDKTTKRNIMWATDAYRELGEAYERSKEITPMLITGNRSDVMKTRARKALEQQSSRTRQHGEVFTPLWVCRKMNDHTDEVWFGRPDVFFKDGEPTPKVEFDGEGDWKKYVDSRRLEITCGEAPFLASRYDVETGEALPIVDRVGVLDRKLRVVNQNAGNEEEWLTWAYRALQATYGYEFQGDNLLIARVNVLMTFGEYLSAWWNRKPTLREYQKAANIVAWNLWQMDGLTGTIPYCKTEKTEPQMDLFQLMGLEESAEQLTIQPPCRVYNWRRQNSMEFSNIGKGGPRGMKFDFIIGNPPYQDETLGENKEYAPPIFHLFLDSVYPLSDVVELIHPARFLFNAGNTPRAWNEKMLNDPHLKVLWYEQDSAKVFPNTSITGGVAITLHDMTKNFGPIGTFHSFQELNSILKKVTATGYESIVCIIYNQIRFNLDALYTEYPQFSASIGSDGRDKRFRNNIFEKIPIFAESKQNGDDVSVIGVVHGKREWRYIPRRFVDADHESLWKYKAVLSTANGASGMLGNTAARITTVPFVLGPNEGYTQTFMSFGAFDSEVAAKNCMTYLKTKFTRVLLGILKVTQDNKRNTWQYVPLQNFTPTSDIDWSCSIPEIDQQLYAKYGLDENEIEFIETHVKEMV